MFACAWRGTPDRAAARDEHGGADLLSTYHFDAEKGLTKGIAPGDLAGLVKEGRGVLWVDMESPTDEETALLDEVFAFHPLAIEDCREEEAYPKLDDFDSHLFLVMLAPDLLSIEQEDPEMLTLDLFLGKGFVVTYHKRPLRSISQLRARVEKSPVDVLGRGPALVAHAILDAAVDQHDAGVSRLDDAAERFQDLILEQPRKEYLDRTLALRSHVLQLRRILSDERNVMVQLSRGPNTLVGEDASRYYADLSEHLDQLSDKLDITRDSLGGARDLYLSVSANRTNEAMRVLAALATILLPLTFITGLYGMNVRLPGGVEGPRGHPLAFPAILGVMALVAVVIFALFRRKNWI